MREVPVPGPGVSFSVIQGYGVRALSAQAVPHPCSANERRRRAGVAILCDRGVAHSQSCVGGASCAFFACRRQTAAAPKRTRRARATLSTLVGAHKTTVGTTLPKNDTPAAGVKRTSSLAPARLRAGQPGTRARTLSVSRHLKQAQTDKVDWIVVLTQNTHWRALLIAWRLRRAVCAC